jgi:hypothetical protein
MVYKLRMNDGNHACLQIDENSFYTNEGRV